MTVGWKFPRTGLGVQGRDLAEDNFASEERSGIVKFSFVRRCRTALMPGRT